jgi:hypothetical protein
MKQTTKVLAVAIFSIAIAAMGMVSMQSVNAASPNFCHDYVDSDGNAGTACYTTHKLCNEGRTADNGNTATSKCSKQ